MAILVSPRMARRLPALLVLCLLGQAFCLPADVRQRRGYSNNEVDSKEHDLVPASSDTSEIQERSGGLPAGVIDDIFGKPPGKDGASQLTLSPEGSPDESSPKESSSEEISLGESNPAADVITSTTTPFAIPEPIDDDDDFDDEFEPMNTSPTTGGGGSNIFSLLRLANAFFPGSSGANTEPKAEQSSPLMTLKMDILRAVLQFGTSLLGMASSSSFSGSTT